MTRPAFEQEILAAVLRISRTSTTKDALEVAVGHPIERYEPTDKDGIAYAQVAVPIKQDLWPEIALWPKTVGPRLLALQSKGLTQGLCLDIAVPVADGQASRSVTVPGTVAAEMGRLGVDLEITICAVANDK